MLDLFGLGAVANQLKEIATQIAPVTEQLKGIATSTASAVAHLDDAINVLHQVATALYATSVTLSILTFISAAAIVSDIVVIIQLRRFLKKKEELKS